MILLSVTVMAKANEVGKKLGDPSPYKAGAATQQPQQQQQQQQQQQTPPPSVNGWFCTMYMDIYYTVHTYMYAVVAFSLQVIPKTM